jgi:hypothetical protein
MTRIRIRIAFATAVALSALVTGGVAHAQPSAPAAASHSAVLAASLQPMGPVVCCDW